MPRSISAKPAMATAMVDCLTERVSASRVPCLPTGRAGSLTLPLSHPPSPPPDSISSYEAQITALKQERQQQQQDCEEKERELGRLKQLLSRAYPLDSLEKQMEKVGIGMASLLPWDLEGC